MAAIMWSVWLVGMALSLLTIYALLRVLYDGEVVDASTEESAETAGTELEADN